MKLSDAQIKALNEIHQHGVTNARKNTFDSIVKFTEATIDPVRPLKLNYDGREALGLTEMPEIDQTKEEIQADQQYFDDEFFAMFGKYKLMNKWRNTEEAWADLSLEEIEQDILTARPINRAARRLHTKRLTSEYRKAFCPRPRKALKLTGASGV